MALKKTRIHRHIVLKMMRSPIFIKIGTGLELFFKHSKTTVSCPMILKYSLQIMQNVELKHHLETMLPQRAGKLQQEQHLLSNVCGQSYG